MYNHYNPCTIQGSSDGCSAIACVAHIWLNPTKVCTWAKTSYIPCGSGHNHWDVVPKKCLYGAEEFSSEVLRRYFLCCVGAEERLKSPK